MAAKNKVLGLVIVAAIVGATVPTVEAADYTEYLVPVMGESRLVYDSNPNYINDHADHYEIHELYTYTYDCWAD